MTVEDSFKAAHSVEALRLVLQVLAPDLRRRLADEAASRGASAVEGVDGVSSQPS